jgi:hypothetical protein
MIGKVATKAKGKRAVNRKYLDIVSSDTSNNNNIHSINNYRNNKNNYSILRIQSAIKTMVLSIIILDSVFISGIGGIYYGMATLLLMVPPILLAKKFYVT